MLEELVAQHGSRRITATGQTMDQLAEQLSSSSSTPVLNKTGLAAKYDFVLEYAASAGELETMKRAGFNDAAEKAAHLPGLSGALQQQLGLRLQPQTGPIEILVVDRCEKQPTED
jgi:uncharacterized protein (TIGR03435 family)